MLSSPNSESFNRKLIGFLILASQQGKKFIDVNAGALDLRVDGDPSSNLQKSVCCQVMRDEMRAGDTILDEPENGQGPSLTVRYLLPRYDSNSSLMNKIVEETIAEAKKWFDDRDAAAVALANSNPDEPELQYTVACDEPELQYTVACDYKFGIRGIAKNIDLAIKWYRKAAGQGHAKAQIELSEMLYYGDEVPQDLGQAAFWAIKAAEQGDAYSQLWLGGLYEKGRGVSQDYLEAAHWYREAAEKGFPNAKWFLGDLYAKGKGVPQDDVQAHFWQSLALNEWEEKHIYLRDREKYLSECSKTGARLSEEEMLAVLNRLTRWRHDHPTT